MPDTKSSKPPRTATLRRRTTCTRSRRVAKVKLFRTGTLAVTLPAPRGAQTFAVYRPSARVGRRSTATLPIVVARWRSRCG